jgi:hypothetical protein
MHAFKAAPTGDRDRKTLLPVTKCGLTYINVRRSFCVTMGQVTECKGVAMTRALASSRHNRLFLVAVVARMAS